MDSCIASDCSVYSSGNVSCMNPCQHSAYCADPDYTDWPFDSQRCTFEFISRTKNIDQLIFVNQSIAVDNEQGWENQAWSLKSANLYASRRRYIFDGFNMSHPFVMFSFKIERHSQTLIRQILMPAVIMAIINVSLLLLNPESDERIVILVINLFSHFIFLEQLRWM